MNIRKAFFSGSWYPAEASACEKEIKHFLKSEEINESSGQKFIGGIVPHAGWYYSGSIACNVISRLQGQETPDVLAIFGMHLAANSQPYIMTKGAWETPFGELEIEREIPDELIKFFDFRIINSEDSIQDNTIELQLPFVKYFFNDVKIIPIGLPPVKESLDIARKLADISIRQGITIKVVGSTDLTHYGPNYGFTPEGIGDLALEWVRNVNDHAVIDAILSMKSMQVLSEAKNNHNACCAGAVAGTIEAAKCLGASYSKQIAYSTSADKSPGSSFVGYTGILFA